MADVAASVLARLKNKAAKSGRSYQLCLQLFCQEEFLRRLEKSKYAENLVLKGGLFLYSLTDFDSRVTADVDFLLRKMPNTPEQLQAILEGIIATQTGNDFITFEIKNVAPIAVAKKYAGIGASLVARIVLHFFAEKLRHLDRPVTFRRFRVGDDVPATDTLIGFADRDRLPVKIEICRGQRQQFSLTDAASVQHFKSIEGNRLVHHFL